MHAWSACMLMSKLKQFHTEASEPKHMYARQWRNSWGAGEHWENFADVPGKEREGKKENGEEQGGKL